MASSSGPAGGEDTSDLINAVVAHLLPCPDCDFRLSEPLLCGGRNNPKHKGCWYRVVRIACVVSSHSSHDPLFRQCLKNNEPLIHDCEHLEWVKDRNKGPLPDDQKRALQGLCQGYLCRTSQGRAQPKNILCAFGVCSRCCKHAQVTVPFLRSCAVSDHNRNLRIPGESRTIRRWLSKLSLA